MKTDSGRGQLGGEDIAPGGSASFTDRNPASPATPLAGSATDDGAVDGLCTEASDAGSCTGARLKLVGGVCRPADGRVSGLSCCVNFQPMSTEVDSDEQWMGLRELFTDEPIVPVGASTFKLEVENGAELRVEQSIATFAREGGAVLSCPSNSTGIGADEARLTGALLWDSSVVLARFISRQHSLLLSPGARVVELGAGLGLCGLAAAAAGYPVFLTDRREVLPLTRCSLSANMAALAVASGSSPSVQVLPLHWGDAEAAAALEPPVDCVLMADCVYELDSIPPLVACLAQLCSPETLVLCAYDVDIGRHAAYAKFKEAVAAAGFLVTLLDAQLTHEDGGTTALALQPLLKPSVALLRLSARGSGMPAS